jgi:hypothetical protein
MSVVGSVRVDPEIVKSDWRQDYASKTVLLLTSCSIPSRQRRTGMWQRHSSWAKRTWSGWTRMGWGRASGTFGCHQTTSYPEGNKDALMYQNHIKDQNIDAGMLYNFSRNCVTLWWWRTSMRSQNRNLPLRWNRLSSFCQARSTGVRFWWHTCLCRDGRCPARGRTRSFRPRLGTLKTEENNKTLKIKKIKIVPIFCMALVFDAMLLGADWQTPPSQLQLLFSAQSAQLESL